MADSGPADAGDEDPLLREFNEILTTEAQFKEPSAAERARKPGWRARRRLARDTRRAARARQPGRHHNLVTTLLTVVVLLVVAGAWIGVARLIRPGAAGTPSPPPPPAPTATAAQPPAAPPADPFAGSPAAGFADGAAGIVPPAPHAVGGYSRAQVRRAYQATQSLLTAADLNQATLLGGKPGAFAGLLISRQRRMFTSHLARTGRTKRGDSRSTRGWVASFAPGSVQFAGNVIKVHGTMRAGAATSPGPAHVLRVTVDYLFVYAVQRPGAPSTRTRVVLRDTGHVDFGHWDSPSGPLQPWWGVTANVAGVQCASTDGYLHPGFRQGPAGRVRPSGAPVDPYDQSAPPPTTCRPVTRT